MSEEDALLRIPARERTAHDRERLRALFERNDDGRGRTRAADVRALEARVETLESELRSPRRVVVSIRDAQRSLDERLDGLERDTRDAVDEIRKEVERLRQRVDELEQQQQSAPTLR